MRENNIYTGTIIYKNINFTFVFDKLKLKLIPPVDKKNDVEHWFMKSLGNGAYTWGDPIYIDEILSGISNETREKIIFIPSSESISKYNSILVIDIDYYILNKYNRDTIDRMAIQGPEIDHIFPTTLALDKLDWNKDGTIGISTKPFNSTTTEKDIFNIEEKEVLVYFGISISSSCQVGKSPVSLSSNLFFEFKPTNDYKFIVHLLEVAKKFIQYLCYRNNVVFSNIELSTPYNNKLHERFANLYEVYNNSLIETYPIEKERLIKYKYLIGNIGKIFSDIVTRNIYIEHIPETYELGRHINAGRFVMITAAFEWEFKRNYPDGIEKSENTKNAEENVTNIINELIKENTSKVKEILKFLKKLVSADNLSSKIVIYGNDYGNISDIFGNHLYELNGEKLNYKKIGERLSNQRNHFAHGDIDKEFIGLSLLDLIYLERIIYIMQLKFYGISDDNIKNAINDLFRCNLII